MLHFLNIPATPANMDKYIAEVRCQRCKTPCCVSLKGGIALRPNEVRTLSLLRDDFLSHTMFRSGQRLLKTPCVFYDNGCTIYEHRTEVCRQFPLNQLYTHKDGRKFLTAANCPAGRDINERFGVKV